jgi:D-glycero-alpha-D-manno-heptose-7-phosphate kinase
VQIGISPGRISFAGGGTDLPEYYEKFGGSVVTTAITQFTYATIHSRHDDTFQAFSPDFQKHYHATDFNKIEHEDGTEIASSVIQKLNYRNGINVILSSDIPAGSGLGASSSLAVNLVNIVSKLKGLNLNSKQIAETAFDVGRNILHWPIGKQDEYISAFGGFNYIEFSSDKVDVIPIKINNSSLNELENNLVLFFIGNLRNSSKILSNQIERIQKNDVDTMNSLHNVKELSQKMYDSIKTSDLTNFAELLNKGWEYKKKFASGITTDFIDDVYSKALSNGAIGGKLTGAGGGGHMLFYCEKSKQKNFIEQMESFGLKHKKFKFYTKKPQILNLYDYIQ